MIKKISKFQKYLSNNRYLSGLENFKEVYDADDDTEINNNNKIEEIKNIE